MFVHVLPVVSPEGSVSVSPQEAVTSRGDNISLSCFAQGGPNNTYVWEKDGISIRGNNSTHNVRITDASFGGNYTCTVTNVAGTDMASTTLYVAPYIVSLLEESTLAASGSNVNISCDAAGFPSPTVNWVDSDNMEVSGSPLLEFTPIMFGDEGLYCCVAVAEINGTSFSVTDNNILVGMYHDILLSHFV